MRQKSRTFSWFVVNKGGCRNKMRRKARNYYDSVKIRHNFALSKEAKVSFFHKVSFSWLIKRRDRSKFLSLISCL